MHNKRLLALGIALLVTVLAATALAAPQAFSLAWWTVDSGGGTSSGGGYSLSGTIGQPDAGSMSGGPFTLTGGFWNALSAAPPGYPVFVPIIRR